LQVTVQSAFDGQLIVAFLHAFVLLHVMSHECASSQLMVEPLQLLLVWHSSSQLRSAGQVICESQPGNGQFCQQALPVSVQGAVQVPWPSPGGVIDPPHWVPVHRLSSSPH
jgi:hypothetical protein